MVFISRISLWFESQRERSNGYRATVYEQGWHVERGGVKLLFLEMNHFWETQVDSWSLEAERGSGVEPSYGFWWRWRKWHCTYTTSPIVGQRRPTAPFFTSTKSSRMALVSVVYSTAPFRSLLFSLLSFYWFLSFVSLNLQYGWYIILFTYVYILLSRFLGFLTFALFHLVLGVRREWIFSFGCNHGITTAIDPPAHNLRSKCCQSSNLRYGQWLVALSCFAASLVLWCIYDGNFLPQK